MERIWYKCDSVYVEEAKVTDWVRRTLFREAITKSKITLKQKRETVHSHRKSQDTRRTIVQTIHNVGLKEVARRMSLLEKKNVWNPIWRLCRPVERFSGLMSTKMHLFDFGIKAILLVNHQSNTWWWYSSIIRVLFLPAGAGKLVVQKVWHQIQGNLKRKPFSSVRD